MTFAEHHSYPGNSLLDFFSRSPLVPQIHRISRKTLFLLPACFSLQSFILILPPHHPAIKSRGLLQQLLPFSLLQLRAKSYVFYQNDNLLNTKNIDASLLSPFGSELHIVSLGLLEFHFRLSCPNLTCGCPTQNLAAQCGPHLSSRQLHPSVDEAKNLLAILYCFLSRLTGILQDRANAKLLTTSAMACFVPSPWIILRELPAAFLFPIPVGFQ